LFITETPALEVTRILKSPKPQNQLANIQYGHQGCRGRCESEPLITADRPPWTALTTLCQPNGTLGVPIISALLAAPSVERVTIVTRNAAKAEALFADHPNVGKAGIAAVADYADGADGALTAAVRGHDALVIRTYRLSPEPFLPSLFPPSRQRLNIPPHHALQTNIS
jgi:hypothetical protein